MPLQMSSGHPDPGADAAHTGRLDGVPPAGSSARRDVETFATSDDGVFPNNPDLPLILYHQSIALSGPAPAETVEKTFQSHGWSGVWRNGIYGVHHYHSTAHEVLGVYAGSAVVQLGGPSGVEVEVSAGDVIVIPAGVAHKRISASTDFGVVGAYPRGQEWDLCYGESGERPGADQNIKNVAAPRTDPVHGSKGPLVQHWRGRD